MKSTALIFASILAVSTAAFAQAPSTAEHAAPGTHPRAERPHHGGGDHGPREGGKSWTRADAMARAGEHFDRVDTNKDGVVDPTERKAAHQKMRAMHEQRKAGKPGHPGQPGEAAPTGTPK